MEIYIQLLHRHVARNVEGLITPKKQNHISK